MQDEDITTDRKNMMLWGFSIYIGDYPNYKHNALCPGSPFLPDGDTLSHSDIGLEIWCNLEGQYISVVRDYSDHSTMVSITLCDLAIFGEPEVWTETREVSV